MQNKCHFNISDVFASHVLAWNMMGREHPWWFVLAHSEYMTPNTAIKNKFYKSGKKQVKDVLQIIVVFLKQF